MFFVQDQTYLRESEINASEMSNESVEILIKKIDEPLRRVQSLITNDEYFKIIETLKPAAATDQRK